MQKLLQLIKNKSAGLLIPAFFSVWAVSRAGSLSTRSILTPVLFLTFTVFFRHASRLKDQRLTASPRHITAFSAALALLFTLLILLAETASLTEGLDNRLFRLLILSACGAGFFFLFYYILLFLFTYAAEHTLTGEKTPVTHLPAITFAACILCWLPYFLYEYPGIMSPDSINQFEQVLGMVPYSNHHPWAHTMVIKFFYSLGSLFTQDQNAALSFFTVFQMCFMAFAASRLIAALQKLHIRNILCILTAAFYALLPYHAVFAVTIWKDVMFSGAVLLFTTALLHLVFHLDSTSKKQFLTLAAYIISGLMMCLFRSNGWYAFLFSLPFLLYAFRRRLQVMLPVHIVILTLALLIKVPVMNSFHVTQPDFVESICIPLQQVARVICEDRELTPAQWDSVHNVIDTTYIKDLYAPGFADNMKELVRAGSPGYLTAHKGEYLRLWLSLGLKYPATYLHAYIDQTIGYWYPDVAYTVGDMDGIIPNETGVYHRPLIAGPVVVKTKEILLKLSDILPLYGLLFSMGAMFWLLLCCIAASLLKKQYSRCILYLPGLAVILTLFIATPVSSEFRYAYSLACALPLYLLLPFLPAKPVREPLQ